MAAAVPEPTAARSDVVVISYDELVTGDLTSLASKIEKVGGVLWVVEWHVRRVRRNAISRNNSYMECPCSFKTCRLMATMASVSLQYKVYRDLQTNENGAFRTLTGSETCPTK